MQLIFSIHSFFIGEDIKGMIVSLNIYSRTSFKIIHNDVAPKNQKYFKKKQVWEILYIERSREKLDQRFRSTFKIQSVYRISDLANVSHEVWGHERKRKCDLFSDDFSGPRGCVLNLLSFRVSLILHDF